MGRSTIALAAVRRWWRIADATGRYRGALVAPPKSRPPLSRPLPPRSLLRSPAEFFPDGPTPPPPPLLSRFSRPCLQSVSRGDDRGPGAHPRRGSTAGPPSTAGGRGDLGRRALGFAEIAVTFAPPVLVTFGFCAIGGGALTGRCWRAAAFLRAILTAW